MNFSMCKVASSVDSEELLHLGRKRARVELVSSQQQLFSCSPQFVPVWPLESKRPKYAVKPTPMATSQASSSVAMPRSKPKSPAMFKTETCDDLDFEVKVLQYSVNEMQDQVNEASVRMQELRGLINDLVALHRQ
ncbi:hypothetical protein PINS_up015982 [Pythium insidiosum]|nr:hypothetical protein PINS_up015982 [Pythium insidiosum]